MAPDPPLSVSEPYGAVVLEPACEGVCECVCVCVWIYSLIPKSSPVSTARICIHKQWKPYSKQSLNYSFIFRMVLHIW